MSFAKNTAVSAQAFYAIRIGKLDAFLLALDQTVAYDSPNYLWFRQRYPRFVYIDRVVVAPAARGRGYARLLYADLFCQARQAGHDLVVYEVNSNPPNPASDELHAALKFADVGTASILRGAKTVRYLARVIGAGAWRDTEASMTVTTRGPKVCRLLAGASRIRTIVSERW
jgi:uncharacterized protein